MKNKLNIQNWEVGDCFIKKIYSEKYPQYNNKYLIIICSGHYQFSNNKRKLPNAYLKLSDKAINNQSDIDEAEFIIYLKVPWSWRYLPYNGNIDADELEKERDKIELFPDEYWFLNEYQVDIGPSRKNKDFLLECQFIAHPNFIKPSDEYFHWKSEEKDNFQMCCLDTPWVIDDILKHYQLNNLRKSVFYQLPKEEMETHKDNLRPIYEKYYVSFMKNYNPDEH